MNKLGSLNSSPKLNAEKNFPRADFSAQSRLPKSDCMPQTTDDQVSFSDELGEEQSDQGQVMQESMRRFEAVRQVNLFLLENGRDGVSAEERQQVTDFVTEQGFPDLVSLLPPAKKRFFGMFG